MENPRKRVKPSDDEVAWSSQASTKKKRPVKKQKTQTRKTDESDSEKSEVEQDPALLPVNTSGLPIFPDELLLEVLSHYPAIPLPTANSESFDPEAPVERRETLLALSQTCSNLRRFFRPYIWQRVEVISGMRFPTGGYNPSDKLFNLELLRQLEIVTIRDPSLSEYVKVVNVEVTKYSGDAVLEELARCIALFPNLRTIKLQLLVNSNSKPGWVPRSGIFSKHSYTQIRSVIVSIKVFELVLSCPGVQRVHSTDGYYRCNDLATMMLHSFRLLRNLELDLPIEGGLEAIIKAFPKLCTLKIRFTLLYFLENQSHLSLLSKFKHLKSLSMAVRPTINKRAKEGILNWATSLLLDLQKKDRKKKWIHLQYTWAVRGNAEVKKRNIALPAPNPLRIDDHK